MPKINDKNHIMIFKIYLFSVFWLRCFSVLSPVLESGDHSGCGVHTSYCGGFSCSVSQALEHAGFSSFTSWALQLWLRNWDSRAQLPLSMWDLSGPGNNLCFLHWSVDSLHWATRDTVILFLNTGILYRLALKYFVYYFLLVLLLDDSNGIEHACTCGKGGFDPWVRKIPWRRE